MRLLSYNIHKGIGGRDRRYRIGRIVEVMTLENPDLVCLQEVARDAPWLRADDQPRLLANEFPAFHWLFQLNVHYQQGGYGNLILSRWPVHVHHHISLRMNRRKPRGAQLTVVETPEGLLHLVNCHLGLSDRERRWQIDRLLTHRLFRESEHLPTLIAGDYNDWRNTLAARVMQARGLTMVTHPLSRFRSFPAWMPVGALDKAFARGPIDVRHARVVRSALTRQASDHLPLVLDFHVNGQGAPLKDDTP